MILYNRTAMPYRIYAQVRELNTRDPTPTEREDDSEVDEYARLVGKGPAGRMLLFRA
jgi:hypothetical protein